MTISIAAADLSSPAFTDLVETHQALMLEVSPPGTSHALPLDGLRTPDVSVWSMFDGDELVGCGALKILSPGHGEIKSMHILAGRRGQGLGKHMLLHLIEEARQRKLTRLSIETGAQTGFSAARKLYENHGFHYCGPFGEYEDDPHSVFMYLDVV